MHHQGELNDLRQRIAIAEWVFAHESRLGQGNPSRKVVAADNTPLAHSRNVSDIASLSGFMRYDRTVLLSVRT